jgi:hypothetical protein
MATFISWFLLLQLLQGDVFRCVYRLLVILVRMIPTTSEQGASVHDLKLMIMAQSTTPKQLRSTSTYL